MLKNMFSCLHRKGKNWLTHYNHQCLHSHKISARGFSIESTASLDLSHKGRGEKRCSLQAWLCGPELCTPCVTQSLWRHRQRRKPIYIHEGGIAI